MSEKSNGLVRALMNSVRRLDTLFPGFIETNTKHQHYRDYGYPEQLSFDHFRQMYRRNGIAKAAVSRVYKRCWQETPAFAEDEEVGEESPAEQGIRERLDQIRFWQSLAEVDKRSLVGAYAGAIIRYGDGEAFDQPVGRVNGLTGLVAIIPAWESQLTVEEWDEDPASETYGHPKMFRFNERAVGNTGGAGRQVKVHPDRVLVWSDDGTVNGESLLEAGYNDLLDMEKVKGAGGEGFWKNAKQAPVLEVDQEANLRDLAEAMGVRPEEIADKLDEVVGDYQKGFDNLLMLQGIKANALNVSLPDPEGFFSTPLMSFAASIDCPVKVLVGNQTGERASEEDEKAWSQVMQSRRINVIKPLLKVLADRFVRVGVFAPHDWTIQLSDLTESTMAEKIDRADKMSSSNQKHSQLGRIIFSPDEIRETVGLPALADDFADDEALADALADINPEEDEQ